MYLEVVLTNKIMCVIRNTDLYSYNTEKVCPFDDFTLLTICGMLNLCSAGYCCRELPIASLSTGECISSLLLLTAF